MTKCSVGESAHSIERKIELNSSKCFASRWIRFELVGISIVSGTTDFIVSKDLSKAEKKADSPHHGRVCDSVGSFKGKSDSLSLVFLKYALTLTILEYVSFASKSFCKNSSQDLLIVVCKRCSKQGAHNCSLSAHLTLAPESVVNGHSLIFKVNSFRIDLSCSSILIPVCDSGKYLGNKTS